MVEGACPPTTMSDAEFQWPLRFQGWVNAYLSKAHLPTLRSAALIALNRRTGTAMPFFGQEIFDKPSQWAAHERPRKAKADAKRLADAWPAGGARGRHPGCPIAPSMSPTCPPITARTPSSAGYGSAGAAPQPDLPLAIRTAALGLSFMGRPYSGASSWRLASVRAEDEARRARVQGYARSVARAGRSGGMAQREVDDVRGRARRKTGRARSRRSASPLRDPIFGYHSRLAGSWARHPRAVV